MIKRLFLRLLALLPHFTAYREAGVPYMTRYWLLGGSTKTTKHPFLPFNLFLHHLHMSDEPTPHDHPWSWAQSLILRGAYREVRALTDGCYLVQDFHRGDVNKLDASTAHYLELLTPSVWTLFVVGPKVQSWGFYTKDGYEHNESFIARHFGATTNNQR